MRRMKRALSKGWVMGLIVLGILLVSAAHLLVDVLKLRPGLTLVYQEDNEFLRDATRVWELRGTFNGKESFPWTSPPQDFIAGSAPRVSCVGELPDRDRNRLWIPEGDYYHAGGGTNYIVMLLFKFDLGDYNRIKVGLQLDMFSTIRTYGWSSTGGTPMLVFWVWNRSAKRWEIFYETQITSTDLRYYTTYSISDRVYSSPLWMITKTPYEPAIGYEGVDKYVEKDAYRDSSVIWVLVTNGYTLGPYSSALRVDYIAWKYKAYGYEEYIKPTIQFQVKGTQNYPHPTKIKAYEGYDIKVRWSYGSALSDVYDIVNCGYAIFGVSPDGRSFNYMYKGTTAAGYSQGHAVSTIYVLGATSFRYVILIPGWKDPFQWSYSVEIYVPPIEINPRYSSDYPINRQFTIDVYLTRELSPVPNKSVSFVLTGTKEDGTSFGPITSSAMSNSDGLAVWSSPAAGLEGGSYNLEISAADPTYNLTYRVTISFTAGKDPIMIKPELQAEYNAMEDFILPIRLYRGANPVTEALRTRVVIGGKEVYYGFMGAEYYLPVPALMTMGKVPLYITVFDGTKYYSENTFLNVKSPLLVRVVGSTLLTVGYPNELLIEVRRFDNQYVDWDVLRITGLEGTSISYSVPIMDIGRAKLLLRSSQPVTSVFVTIYVTKAGYISGSCSVMLDFKLPRYTILTNLPSAELGGRVNPYSRVEFVIETRGPDGAVVDPSSLEVWIIDPANIKRPPGRLEKVGTGKWLCAFEVGQAGLYIVQITAAGGNFSTTTYDVKVDASVIGGWDIIRSFLTTPVLIGIVLFLLLVFWRFTRAVRGMRRPAPEAGA